MLSLAGAIGAVALLGSDPLDDGKLRRGEVLARTVAEAGPGGRVEAAIDIEAPPSRVWRVMLDCAGAPRFVPKLETCAVVETSADGRSDVRRHTLRFLPILPRLTIVFRSIYEPEREIRFSRTEGDLAVMEGRWRLAPLDGGRRTRILYEVRMAPKTPLPKALVANGIRDDTPKVLRALRREVLSRPQS